MAVTTKNYGDNGRVRILDVVISDVNDRWGGDKHLTVKVAVATAYHYNLSAEVHRLRFDGYQDRDYAFTGKHPLADDDIGSLELSAQTSAGYDTSRLYGEGIEYRDVYSINLIRAERMTKVLRHIDKNLRAREVADGYHLNFGQYIARVGNILGCVGARITVPDSLKHDWEHSNERFCYNTGDVVNEVTSLADRWWKDQQKAKEEAAS